MKKMILIAALISAIGLTGCVNRDQADAKLGKACAAAIDQFLGDGQKIDRVQNVTTSPAPIGKGYRHVRLQTITIDGWLEETNEYECIFDESFGFLNMNYTASFYQLRIDDQIIGKSGNEIVGSAQDFVKITDAVREALYE